MRDALYEENGEWRTHGGYSIHDAARAAVAKAAELGEDIPFVFNDTRVVVSGDDNPAQTCQIWNLKREVNRLRAKAG